METQQLDYNEPPFGFYIEERQIEGRSIFAWLATYGLNHTASRGEECEERSQALHLWPRIVAWPDELVRACVAYLINDDPRPWSDDHERDALDA